jgi:hypothetical protein
MGLGLARLELGLGMGLGLLRLGFRIRLGLGRLGSRLGLLGSILGMAVLLVRPLDLRRCFGALCPRSLSRIKKFIRLYMQPIGAPISSHSDTPRLTTLTAPRSIQSFIPSHSWEKKKGFERWPIKISP